MFNFDVNALTDKIQPAVESFANSIGTKADQLWALGLTMERVKGIFELSVAGIALIGICWLPSIWKKTAAWSKKLNGMHDGAEWIFPIIPSVILPVVFLTTLYGGMIKTLVPQYALIMDIMNFITNHAPSK